jgi:hypothetical protein
MRTVDEPDAVGLLLPAADIRVQSIEVDNGYGCIELRQSLVPVSGSNT